jgi:hypothetical protein
LGCKKKIYQFQPNVAPQEIEIQKTKTETETTPVTAVSIEREGRQLLADKINGTLIGLWLLVPEHLRLGSWDLLQGWSGTTETLALAPRLGLQLIHEAALCLNGIRQKRSLRHKGFEVLNGLPFVASDHAVHTLLNERTMADAERLQVVLGQLRYANGHYPGLLVLIDPHRIQSWTQRHVPLNKTKTNAPTRKTLQTFFAIDGRRSQPIFGGLGSSAVTISHATQNLLTQRRAILPASVLYIGDGEHFTVENLRTLERFNLCYLFPMPQQPSLVAQLPTLNYRGCWAGYAVAETEYQRPPLNQKIRMLVQRTGERPENFTYKPFVTNSQLPAVKLMHQYFPERWNIEEFFNTEADFGWKRAATLNLNIRFNKLSLSLIAQTLVYQFRQKLPPELRQLTAAGLAEKVFSRIEGDLRVKDDTIIVTLYNAPNFDYFKEHYTNLPTKLINQGQNPKIPWLFDFKLDFRFK